MGTRVKTFTDPGDAVASRYAEALFESANAEHQIGQAFEELSLIGALLRESPDLRQFLGNPDVEPDEKIGLLDRALGGGWSSLTQAFVKMVVSMGRPESLPAMVPAFQALVDKAQQRLRVVVRSAKPLPETILNRLQAHLERAERKEIVLETELAPELLGGVQLVLGHRVIDSSVQRHLADLRERLQTVRVH